MKKQRDKSKIIQNILQCIQDGNNIPTHIMYATQLSWKTFDKYLNNIILSELIEVHVIGDEHNRQKYLYTITPKGKRLLKIMYEIQEIIQ